MPFTSPPILHYFFWQHAPWNINLIYTSFSLYITYFYIGKLKNNFYNLALSILLLFFLIGSQLLTLRLQLFFLCQPHIYVSSGFFFQSQKKNFCGKFSLLLLFHIFTLILLSMNF